MHIKKHAKSSTRPSATLSFAKMAQELSAIHSKFDALSTEHKKTTQDIAESFRTLIEMTGNIDIKLDSRTATLQTILDNHEHRLTRIETRRATSYWVIPV